ncbi:MAG: hypothetical protein HKN11_10185 [Rhizobiales bacterium]|nr:hypothetical protein [Hyphomicrobiales bacterium]
MNDDEDTGFLDSFFMRIMAGVVIVVCVGILAFLNREKLIAQSVEEPPGLNPDFVKCRDIRVAQVDKLLADGIIKQDRYEVFRNRAIEACTGQFPPQL